MCSSLSVLRVIVVGVLFTFTPVARSDEWVTCKRDVSTGQFLWMRGKSTVPLENPVFRPSSTIPNVGTCQVSNDQLRKAHGLKL